MMDFDAFMKKNSKKIYEITKKNAEYDTEGRAIITKNDEWRDEPEWDTYYKELIANGRNSSARRMVR